jgi:hypothetical protein
MLSVLCLGCALRVGVVCVAHIVHAFAHHVPFLREGATEWLTQRVRLHSQLSYWPVYG